jgi:SHS2 domain-containing protein
MKKDFELLDHTADIKLRVYGKNLQELFRNALVGMFQSINPTSRMCRREQDRIVCDQLPEHHHVEVTAGDRELLLVDFLAQALYLCDVHNQIYLDAEFHEMSDTHLRVTLHGIRIDGFGVEIKAVTYNDLVVKQVGDHWIAEIVFDI